MFGVLFRPFPTQKICLYKLPACEGSEQMYVVNFPKKGNRVAFYIMALVSIPMDPAHY